MHPFITAMVLTLAALGTSPTLAQGTGRIVEVNNFPTKTIAPRNISIWLPPGYDESGNTRYPVIYMHDGQNIFLPGRAYGGKEWGIDESMSRLIAAKQVRPAIIVGVWNGEKRYQEYYPAKWSNFLPKDYQTRIAKGQPYPPMGDAYLSYLVKEVKPYIDRTYRTLTGPENTGVMGSSMGGLISLYAIAEYPEVFGRAACVSIHLPLGNVDGEYGPKPSDPEVLAKGLAAYLQSTKLRPDDAHKLYFDQGTGLLDVMYTPYTAAVAPELAKIGWKAPKFITRSYEGADHNEAAWRERSEVLLSFLLDPPTE